MQNIQKFSSPPEKKLKLKNFLMNSLRKIYQKLITNKKKENFDGKKIAIKIHNYFPKQGKKKEKSLNENYFCGKAERYIKESIKKLSFCFLEK